MDSVIVEALVETRRLLADLRGVPAAHGLGVRRNLLERAAATIELQSTAREHVVTLTRLILDARDETVALHRRHRVLAEALAEAMD